VSGVIIVDVKHLNDVVVRQFLEIRGFPVLLKDSGSYYCNSDKS